MFEIGLVHFLIVSFLLAAAGVATMLTKRNAIGILMGVELLLNAAAINFVAFNHYGHDTAQGMLQVTQADHDDMVARLDRAVITTPQAAGVAAVRLTLATDAAPEDGQTHALPDEAEGAALPAYATQAVQRAVRQWVHQRYPDARAVQVQRADVLGLPTVGSKVLFTGPAMDGLVFAIFIIVLAAAEAAIALAIFLNFYNNYSSIDVEKASAMRG